ncbi:protein of unknown function [Octadecabacter temperatus]|uniref:Uncharacterized protein n=1 Tax=Octadecabacter temperatus TaxID=1458307 RepID=A0A0K0Y429_9RHOB|nr:DUF4177 domain-containing protein [Octadecabacter temperatus]AKS45690.1 hypothetical protein OSB_11340 [Octadecabacter temperatus]SIN98418.1 protein of unknown function [Octadecabacter temperatus]
MTGFEYKVVPAPMRGLKAKGVKGTPARFANALQSVMNDLGADGWEYQRTDTLPVEERVGLTGKNTTFQNMLVFRRAIELQVEDAPEVAALIEDQTEVLEDVTEPDVAVEDIAAASETDAPIEDAPVVDVVEPESDETMPLEAKDRVSETLNAPFVFPWNKRRAAGAPSNDDQPQHPAE